MIRVIGDETDLSVEEDVARDGGVGQLDDRVTFGGQLVTNDARLFLLVVIERAVVHHVQMTLLRREMIIQFIAIYSNSMRK